MSLGSELQFLVMRILKHHRVKVISIIPCLMVYYIASVLFFTVFLVSLHDD